MTAPWLHLLWIVAGVVITAALVAALVYWTRQEDRTRPQAGAPPPVPDQDDRSAPTSTA